MKRTPLLPAMVIGPWLAMMTVMAGCTAESGILRSPGGPAAAMRIFVRDSATREPIAGAAVAAETCSRDHPFSAASILYQTGPEASRASTNDRGSALVSVLAEREYRVVVWAPGRSPVVFWPESQAGRRGEWVDAELPPGGADAGVQLRIAHQEPGR